MGTTFLNSISFRAKVHLYADLSLDLMQKIENNLGSDGTENQTLLYCKAGLFGSLEFSSNKIGALLQKVARFQICNLFLRKNLALTITYFKLF